MESNVRTKVLVREVMNSPLITASLNDTIKTLAEKMTKYDIGSIVITEDENPRGIVTEKDIVHKVVAKGNSPSMLLAKDIMSSPFHTIPDDKDITEAAKLMRKFGIKRLGVIYKNKLVGIVSIYDLISVTPELIGLISEKTQIMTGEPRKRSGGTLTGYCDACRQWSDFLLEVDGKYQCEECREEKKIPQE
ncbi:MAG: CBS domain-containing protein [Nitrososphaeraceae archaeon]|nr:CBS domain-containing protein [Nitrososphaeraceae archaeon]